MRETPPAGPAWAIASANLVRPATTHRLNIDPEDVQRDLLRLVLTIVAFLKEVLEEQAARRFESGSLSETEAERVGLAFLRLDAAIARLIDDFGLDERDLNLHLGPLGDLM